MNLLILKELSQKYLDATDIDAFNPSQESINRALTQLKNYVEGCHKQDPDNIEIILRLAIAYYFLNEEDTGVAYLDRVPESHFLYSKSLLLRAWILEEYMPLDEAAYNNLIKTSQRETNPEIKSMLLYCASWLWNIDFNQKRNLLAESVKLCDKHANNLKSWGVLMQSCGQKALGTSLILDAMRNIVEVSDRYISGDITDPDEFIDIHIKGIHINQSLFLFFINCIDPNGFKWMEDLQKKLHSENEAAH